MNGWIPQGNAVGVRISKAEPLKTSMHEDEAKHLTSPSQYGLRGPLPRGLSREERKRAWEARYVASGGHKSEKWQRRADRAEVLRNVGLAGATAAGTGALVRHWKGLRAVERLGIGAGVLGGGAEMYGEYARHRRASYTSAPGGVAASALRRLRANDPGEET